MMGNNQNNKPNLGWLFYKDYYSGLREIMVFDSRTDRVTVKKNGDDKAFFENKKKTILESSFNLSGQLIPDATHLFLKTTYPGLVTGIGTLHSVRMAGELKLGFQFDYTTGLPYIPGSSVKGMLRSVFPYSWEVNEAKEKDDVVQLYRTSRMNYIRFLFKKLKTDTGVGIDLSNDEIRAIEYAVFEGYYANGYISTFARHVFFDAQVAKAAAIGQKSGLLDTDYITPHDNPLKDPIPILFLKVAPEVMFDFSFRLPDIVLIDSKAYPASLKEKSAGKVIKDSTLKRLFKLILLDIGIGAKTNVGYGQFVDDAEKE